MSTPPAARPATSSVAAPPIQMARLCVWSRGCRARRRPARRYPTRCDRRAPRSAPSTMIRLLPPPSRRIARPGSTDTSAPAPISMSAPSSMRCERSVRSAPARCVSAPLSGFSWYTGASSSAGAGRWPVASLPGSYRYTGIATSSVAPSATRRPSRPLMSYSRSPRAAATDRAAGLGLRRAGRSMGRPVGQRIGPPITTFPSVSSVSEPPPAMP